MGYCTRRGRRQWHPTPVLLPGKSHGRRSPVGCCLVGSLRVRHDWATSLSLFTFMHGEGNGNPLQCSCLENPRDVEPGGLPSCGVAQNRTRLKRLSSSSSSSTSRRTSMPCASSPSWIFCYSRTSSKPLKMIMLQHMHLTNFGLSFIYGLLNTSHVFLTALLDKPLLNLKMSYWNYF